MAVQEAGDFYYDKGRQDYISGRYDQPFPPPTLFELDEFELHCNIAYRKGYLDEKDGKGDHSFSLN
jgi:hypothetical protein